jgi:hypothetical protein
MTWSSKHTDQTHTTQADLRGGGRKCKRQRFEQGMEIKDDQLDSTVKLFWTIKAHYQTPPVEELFWSIKAHCQTPPVEGLRQFCVKRFSSSKQ